MKTSTPPPPRKSYWYRDTPYIVRPGTYYSSQAHRVFARVGGPGALSLGISMLDNPRWNQNRTSIYRWGYPVELRGTGGLIPGNMLQPVRYAARLIGVVLTDEDMRV